MSIESPLQIPSFWLTKGSLPSTTATRSGAAEAVEAPARNRAKMTVRPLNLHNRPATFFHPPEQEDEPPAIRAMMLMNQNGEAASSMRIGWTTFIEFYDENWQAGLPPSKMVNFLMSWFRLKSRRLTAQPAPTSIIG
jgi:hypothetical protein